MRLLILLVYLGVGLVVAGNHHYLGDLNNLSQVVSAVLAVVLWPLVLLGVDLHIGGIPKVKVDNGG
jgi:ABC-type Na+ efflux pump permease subunit